MQSNSFISSAVIGSRLIGGLPGCSYCGVGGLQPGRRAEAAVAQQRVADELDLRERAAGDEQHADLLADDAHLAAGDVVVASSARRRRLRARRGARACAGRSSLNSNGTSCTRPALLQHDLLPADLLPRPAVAAALEHDASRRHLAMPRDSISTRTRVRVADEDDGADFELGELRVARAFGRARRDGDDRHALGRRELGGLRAAARRRWIGRR